MKRGLHISSSSFPFRNFSLNHTLKQLSYFAFRSLHSGPMEFISEKILLIPFLFVSAHSFGIYQRKQNWKMKSVQWKQWYPSPMPITWRSNNSESSKEMQGCWETGIRLNTRPTWHGLNNGTVAMLDWFASTPETFEFTIYILSTGRPWSRIFLQLRIIKSAAGAHGSARRMRNKVLTKTTT